MSKKLKAFIPRMFDQRVIVLGDIMLDEYLTGRTTRLSREAPVPVLEFESRQHIPGGAANPAANIAALGSQAVQVGVLGDDKAARQLVKSMQARGINTDALVMDASRPTTVKMRLMAHMGLRFPQQVARMDTLSREPINDEIVQQVRQQVQVEIRYADAVLFSDYRGGMLGKALVEALCDVARKNGKLITADAQGSLKKYREVALVKCNAAEAADFLGRTLVTDTDFANAAQTLRYRLRLSVGMVITRGGDGATLATPDDVHHCAAPFVSDVFDTVGAGDTAIAVITLALAAGATAREAVMLANYASGLVVRKVGNYAPTPDELAWALDTWQIR